MVDLEIARRRERGAGCGYVLQADAAHDRVVLARHDAHRIVAMRRGSAITSMLEERFAAVGGPLRRTASPAARAFIDFILREAVAADAFARRDG